jgi:hypothetical protein
VSDLGAQGMERDPQQSESRGGEVDEDPCKIVRSVTMYMTGALSSTKPNVRVKGSSGYDVIRRTLLKYNDIFKQCLSSGV